MVFQSTEKAHNFNIENKQQMGTGWFKFYKFHRIEKRMEIMWFLNDLVFTIFFNKTEKFYKYDYIEMRRVFSY